MFAGLRRNSAAQRLREEHLYERVVDELAHEKRRNGLWAKALADSSGNKEHAEALYIQYRVQSIKDELEVSGGPTDQAQSQQGNQSKPSGVGGWLLLLVLGMMVLGPLLGAARIAGGTMTAELDHPALLSTAEWTTYKTTTWIVYAAIVLASFYGGWSLAFRREWSAVVRAKIMLWLSGPLGSLCLGIAVPAMALPGASTIDRSFVGALIGQVIAASIWTGYLSYSKRVENTYAMKSDERRRAFPLRALDGREAMRWTAGSLLGFVILFFFFGQNWVDFAAGLLGKERDSRWAIFLGFAMVANLLTAVIWLASRQSQAIRQSWPFEPILSSKSPVLRLLLRISVFQWLIAVLFVAERVAS